VKIRRPKISMIFFLLTALFLTSNMCGLESAFASLASRAHSCCQPDEEKQDRKVCCDSLLSLEATSFKSKGLFLTVETDFVILPGTWKDRGFAFDSELVTRRNEDSKIFVQKRLFQSSRSIHSPPLSS